MCQGYASEANAVKRHSLSTQASVLRQLPVLVGCSLRLKHTQFFFSDVAPSTTATEIRSKMVMTMKEKDGHFFFQFFVCFFFSQQTY